MLSSEASLHIADEPPLGSVRLERPSPPLLEAPPPILVPLALHTREAVAVENWLAMLGGKEIHPQERALLKAQILEASEKGFSVFGGIYSGKTKGAKQIQGMIDEGDIGSAEDVVAIEAGERVLLLLHSNPSPSAPQNPPSIVYPSDQRRARAAQLLRQAHENEARYRAYLNRTRQQQTLASAPFTSPFPSPPEIPAIVSLPEGEGIQNKPPSAAELPQPSIRPRRRPAAPIDQSHATG